VAPDQPTRAVLDEITKSTILEAAQVSFQDFSEKTPEVLKLCLVFFQGREVKYIKLYKPEGSSLGFSVVGLKSAHKGELGIYVQEIQPQGIAGKDGRLLEGDQVTKI